MQSPSSSDSGQNSFSLHGKICGEMFYPKLKLLRFVWRRHAGAHPDGLEHGYREPTQTSVTEFRYNSLNLF